MSDDVTQDLAHARGECKSVARPCPVCDGREAFVLRTQCFVVPEDCPLPASYDVVSCCSCGATYADTTAPQDAYDRYYTESSRYEDKSTGSGGGDRPDDRRRLEATSGYIASKLPHVGVGVLDIGCGPGGLLSCLAETGCTNLGGIDPSAVCVERVSALGVDAMQGTIFKVRTSTEPQFGCVALTHVLEHIVDVRRAIEASLTWLAPGALLYVEVPDASRYAERFVVPYYYFDIEHINHFDPESLRNLALVEGLEVVDTLQKDVSFSGGALYPCVGVMYRLPAERPMAAPPEFSSRARDAVAAYVERSESPESFDELRGLESGAQPIAVWGAGSYTQRLLCDGPLRNVAIELLVDKDSKKQGTVLGGLTVEAPQALLGFKGVIVVASALFADEILGEISAMGLENHVVVAR